MRKNMVQLNHKGGKSNVQVKNQSQECNLRKFDENEKGQRRSPFKSDFATTKKTRRCYAKNRCGQRGGYALRLPRFEICEITKKRLP